MRTSTRSLAALACSVVVGIGFVSLTGCSSADEGGGTLIGGSDGTDTGSEGTGSDSTGKASSTTKTTTPAASATTTAPAATSTPAPVATTAPTTGSTDSSAVCSAPGNKGNSMGVGLYCTDTSQCPNGDVCTSDVGAPSNDVFCTVFCKTDADCGEGATCFTDPRYGAACLTPACLVLAKNAS